MLTPGEILIAMVAAGFFLCMVFRSLKIFSCCTFLFSSHMIFLFFFFFFFHPARRSGKDALRNGARAVNNFWRDVQQGSPAAGTPPPPPPPPAATSYTTPPQRVIQNENFP